MDLSPGLLFLCSLLCSVAAQAPVVTVKPRSASVSQGGSVEFRCQVKDATQSTTFHWGRVNGQAFPDNVAVNGHVLSVTNARLAHEGRYRCTARNAAGTGTAVGSLFINRAPKVRLTPAGPVRVPEGESVSVECRATGWPRPTLSWKRQGSSPPPVTVTNDVNTMQWPAVRPEHSGVYICQAKNTEGVTEVKVEIIVEGALGAPVASVTPTNMTAVEGQSVSMRCQASGFPPPNITWSKLRAPLPWKHTVDGGVLRLTNVGRQDSGQYICNATNVHGYSEAYMQMEVESPPYATSLPDNVNLRPGDTLSLQCLAHGTHPILFEWSRGDGSSLPAGTETTEDGKLRIANVKVSHRGKYKCVASNHIGTSEVLATVKIKA